MLADVVAMVEDVKTTQGVCVIGRCYSHLWLMELPLVSIYFKFWDVKKNLIPNMWQMVFAYISI